MRAIVDTGVLVSALIRRQGTPGAVLLALREGHFTLVYSTDLLVEIVEVLGRPALRFKYQFEVDDITALVNLIRLRGELVTPQRKVAAWRDPNDDKFLEAALEGEVDCIVSGDADLLALTPYEGIPILRPAEFLACL